MLKLTAFVLATLLSVQLLQAQSWHWAKKALISDNVQTSPSKTVIDSRGNTILFSLRAGRSILSKHDSYGTLLWKQELFLAGTSGVGQASLCLDNLDNIYVTMAAVARINNTVINTPAPYGLLKFNTNGRYLWSKRIDFPPTSILPNIIFSVNRIFLTVPIRPFGTATYGTTTFSNIGGNTSCTLLAALDTGGSVRWTKRIFSPAQPLSCNVSDVYPEITTNQNQDLLLVGYATDKLMVESTAAIDYPHNCRQYAYGMVLNGATGAVKWAADLQLDTLMPKPKLSIFRRATLSAILPNGYAVVYRYLTQDTAIVTPYHRIVAISNKLYLFDTNGALVRKDSIGNRNTGWHEMLQLRAGDRNNFFSAGIYNGFSPGNIVETKTFEARKWDTSLAVVWKRNTDFARLFPYFSSTDFDYRDNALNFILQSGSGSGSYTYAYFGADSLLPHLNNLYARMLDSANFFSGTVYFDLNENGEQDAGEPAAPQVFIGNMAGDTIYGVTRSNGFYEVDKGPGSFQLRPINLAAIYPHHTISQPANYSVNLTGYGAYSLNQNFGLRKSAALTDGQISLTPYGIHRPGGTVHYKVVVQNMGTNSFGGTYQLTFDTSKLQWQSSGQTASATAPGNLTFAVAGLSPLADVSNHLTFRVKTNLGQQDTIKVRVQLATLPNDGLLINNRDSAISVVRSSFDPNTKEVFPLKELRYDSALAGKEEIDYRIHFQNVGNDTAFAVTILDTLDAKLDVTTLRFISSSHPVTMTWSGANTLRFYFPGIRLVDSTKNEKQSHGVVRFKIKPKRNVLLPDILRNNASIYFDYNSPIKTNTVHTGFFNAVIAPVTTVGNFEKELWIGSNPVKGQLYYKVIASNFHEKMRVNIFDEAGRLVYTTTKTIRTEQMETTDVSHMVQGIYYLELQGTKNRFVKKLMVQ